MAKQAKTPRLLTHEQVWTALDRLAARAGLSASGLARRAGLDPTTFNKSKRVTPDGRERWPSTESVAKALAAADASIETFVQLTGDGGARLAISVPLLGLAQAAQRGQFDEHGRLAGKGFEEIALPSLDGDHAFALEISGDAYEPAYRDGDVLLVSSATAIRRGDRVVVKTGGEVVIGELRRRTPKALELATLGAAPGDRAIAASDVEWIARIIWVRQ